jgi:hypothetical protein
MDVVRVPKMRGVGRADGRGPVIEFSGVEPTP